MLCSDMSCVGLMQKWKDLTRERNFIGIGFSCDSLFVEVITFWAHAEAGLQFTRKGFLMRQSSSSTLIMERGI